MAVIRNTRAVHVKAGQNLRNTLIESKDDLDMAGRILRCNRDGVLSPNSGCLAKDTVTNLGLNLLDLFDCLLLVKPIYEEVNIRSRSELVMVI